MSRSIVDYVKQLSSLYQSVFASRRYAEELPFYRIIKLPDETDNRIFFQTVPTTNVLKILPEEIMRGDLLLGFNKADIAVITYLGAKNEISFQQISQKPRKLFRVLTQLFIKGKTLFVIEKDTGEVVKCEADKLYQDETIADCFVGKDAMKIGYSAAENHYARISELKSH